MSLPRRSFLSLASLTALAPLELSAGQALPAASMAAPISDSISASFPAHDPALARDMVGVSHGNIERVRELLAGRPALANASWDWGYGDWESALGAASHVGNREIAGLLLAAGARPSIFSAAMLGQLDVVKAFVAASPGIQKTRGPHGITLLAHGNAGGPASAPVVAYLQSLGDADATLPNAPLSDTDRTAIAGVYTFGAEPSQRLTVSLNERGASIQRDGGSARGLLHIGERVFHPVGGTSVRVRFSTGVRAETVTIEDGPLVVTATRVAG